MESRAVLSGGDHVTVYPDFVPRLNAATGGSPAFNRDSVLMRALEQAASTLTAAQMTEGLAPSSVSGILYDLTDSELKTQLDKPSAWDAYNAEKRLAAVFLYSSGKNEAEVVSAFKTEVLDKINITSTRATQGNGFTNSYVNYAAVCRVVDPASGTAVWAVAPLFHRFVD